MYETSCTKWYKKGEEKEKKRKENWTQVPSPRWLEFHPTCFLKYEAKKYYTIRL